MTSACMYDNMSHLAKDTRESMNADVPLNETEQLWKKENR